MYRLFSIVFSTAASTALLVGGLLLTGSLAQAQYGPDRRYAPDSVAATIDRVHEDLNRAYAGWIVSGSDRRRLDHAEHQLRDFAAKWSRGRFDKGELDDAIGSIQHIVDKNAMPPGERDALYRDVNQLRGMREAYDRHELGGRW